jgi:hypothetical protein
LRLGVYLAQPDAVGRSGALDQEAFRQAVIGGLKPELVVRIHSGQWVPGIRWVPVRKFVPVREGVRGQFRFGYVARIVVRKQLGFGIGSLIRERAGVKQRVRGWGGVWPVGWFPVLVFAGVVPAGG